MCITNIDLAMAHMIRKMKHQNRMKVEIFPRWPQDCPTVVPRVTSLSPKMVTKGP